jgi:hypothetical protein
MIPIVVTFYMAVAFIGGFWVGFGLSALVNGGKK